MMHTLVTAVIGLVAMVISVALGAPLTAAVLRLVSHGNGGSRLPVTSSTTGGHGGTSRQEKVDEGAVAAPGVLKGGLWIGLLERFAITGCILAGYPAGIAIVVAIKGLGRFSTLQSATDGSVGERFLIGTLASYIWAALAAVLGLSLMEAIP